MADSVATPADAAFAEVVDVFGLVAFGEEGGGGLVLSEVDLDAARHAEDFGGGVHLSSLVAGLSEADHVGVDQLVEDVVCDLGREGEQWTALSDTWVAGRSRLDGLCCC